MKAKFKEVGVHVIKADQVPDNGLIPDPEQKDEEKEEEEGKVDDEGESDTEDPPPTTSTAPVQLGVDDFLSQNFYGN